MLQLYNFELSRQQIGLYFPDACDQPNKGTDAAQSA
jgi:hypothetical protein